MTDLLQVFITFTPGIQSFFNVPDGLNWQGWVKSLVGMVFIYAVVEIEKALVDPVMVPLVRPLFNFLSG